MNMPERHELLDLGDKKKIVITKDTKVPNAASFEVEVEDHTLGNMLKMQCLKMREVTFSGYRVPHPLEHKFILKIQTTKDSTPEKALHTAVSDLINQVQMLDSKFKDGLIRFGGQDNFNRMFQ